MALQKDYSYKGATANYWRIDKTHVNVSSGKTTVELRVYWNKAARDVDTLNFLPHREVKEFNEIDMTREDMYESVKESIIVDEEETNYFATAEDV